jgi:Rps23 Pro-64 3,4-dihydroxylase Tpa1-like proline 4-hydroxylase
MVQRRSRQKSSLYCRVENFLAEHENRRFLEMIYRNACRFEPSSTTTKEPNYRKSLVFYPPDEYFAKLPELINSCLPFVTRALGKSRFTVREVDLQVTAHNDGDFFKIHSDRGSGKTRNRSITFVYYLHYVPRSFTGGELILYSPLTKKRRFVVEPSNNSIVFFRSEREHAVRRVNCQSHKFEDSRFTINGWICR